VESFWVARKVVEWAAVHWVEKLVDQSETISKHPGEPN
jgi:hypothetical protein